MKPQAKPTRLQSTRMGRGPQPGIPSAAGWEVGEGKAGAGVAAGLGRRVGVDVEVDVAVGVAVGVFVGVGDGVGV